MFSCPVFESRVFHLQDEGGKDALEVLRIMRTRLRQAILSKVPSSSLSFGKVCTSATETADSEQPIKLTFADGTTEECDMLVVADGANSKLRDSLLPHEKPSYTGICMLMVSHLTSPKAS